MSVSFWHKWAMQFSCRHSIFLAKYIIDMSTHNFVIHKVDIWVFQKKNPADFSVVVKFILWRRNRSSTLFALALKRQEANPTEWQIAVLWNSSYSRSFINTTLHWQLYSNDSTSFHSKKAKLSHEKNQLSHEKNYSLFKFRLCAKLLLNTEV